jgi:hypothetical protein
MIDPIATGGVRGGARDQPPGRDALGPSTALGVTRISLRVFGPWPTPDKIGGLLHPIAPARRMQEERQEETYMGVARAVSWTLCVAATAAMGAVTACSSDAAPEDPAPSQTAEARSGRTAARAMLGLAAGHEVAGDPARAEALADYEAVADDLIAVVERKEPGVFDRFGADVSSRDGERFVSAWRAMRAKLEAAGTSAALANAVSRDAHFRGAHVQSFAFGSDLAPSDFGYQPPNDGIPNLGRGPDGWFGDGNVGAGAAAADLRGLLADPFTPWRTLAQVDSGELAPDPESRLGAYACTGGHAAGTVGHAVHNAIGFIYLSLGTYGEEKIGRVFCSDEAKKLFDDPVEGDSSVRVAQIEQRYWDNVRSEDGFSAGGQLGAAFSPTARDFLQKHVFRGSGESSSSSSSSGASSGGASSGGASSGGGASSSGGSSSGGASSGGSSSGGSSSGDPGDAGADAALRKTDCADKADGWWCLDTGGWMAYCKNKQIASGCGCAACAPGGGGVPASCSSPPPPGACTSQ